jgi:hypothetical protein
MVKCTVRKKVAVVYFKIFYQHFLGDTEENRWKESQNKPVFPDDITVENLNMRIR